MAYVHNCLAHLCPALRHNIVDHHDILILLLHPVGDTVNLMNIYSDDCNYAICCLNEEVDSLPAFHYMGGDFNCHSEVWDGNVLHHQWAAQHLLSVANNLGLECCLWVHSSFAKAVHACHLLTEPFDANANKARPGHCLMDLFSWRIHFKESESKEDVDQAKFLEQQFDLSDAIPSCILVATNASVPTEGKWQAAWLWHGGKFLWRTHHAAGRVMALDANHYAIWIGLGLAMVVPEAKSIKLFTDHFAAARKAVDPSIHAGQGHSLEVCHMLANWLRANPKQSVIFVKVLSRLEWGFHKDVHDYVTDLSSWVSMGWHPYTMLASVQLTPARTSGFIYSTPVLSMLVEASCTSTTVEAENSSPPMFFFFF
jgi:hypothetical protein